MISKTFLQSIISKYYMEGLIESTKWIVKDNKLYINFLSPNKNLVGNIKVNNFTLIDSEFGIYDTTKLNKLISVINKDLNIEILKSGKTYTKLILSDNQFSINYSLASLSLIDKVPEIEEPEYDIELNLENDDIISIIRAKTALIDANVVSIQPFTTFQGDGHIELIFGNNDDYSNKISYYLTQIIKNTPEHYKVIYNSDLLKGIMNANKEASRAKLYLSLNGIMKIEFDNGEIKSKYFIIQEESY